MSTRFSFAVIGAYVGLHIWSCAIGWHSFLDSSYYAAGFSVGMAVLGVFLAGGLSGDVVRSCHHVFHVSRGLRLPRRRNLM